MARQINEVEQRLLIFYRKYQLVQLVSGLIGNLVIIGVTFLIIIVMNAWLMPAEGWRRAFFYGFITISAGSVLWYVIFPLFRIFAQKRKQRLRFGERILRSKLPEIQDRLLNLIELAELDESGYSKELIIASIEDKTEGLRPFNFNLAIPYRKIVTPFLFLILAAALVTVLNQVSPDFVRSGYSRTIHYNLPDTTIKPIDFLLENDSLKVLMGEDFVVVAKVVNQVSENDVFLRIGETRYEMEKSEQNYRYTIPSVNGQLNFWLISGDFTKGPFTLDVIALPSLKLLEIRVIPPEYTLLSPQVLQNQGDLVIAEGSLVSWFIDRQNTDQTALYFDRDTVWFGATQTEASRSIRRSQSYEVVLFSRELTQEFASRFSIEVIRDEYPMIEANGESDSTSSNRTYLECSIQDDYGFSQMDFVVRNPVSLDTLFLDQVILREAQIFQQIYYTADFESMRLSQSEVEYFFTVWDNDAINGPKSSTSKVFNKSLLSAEEIFQQNRLKGEEIAKDIDESKDLLGDLKERIADLMKSQMIENKENWEIKNQVEEITEMRDVLEEMINNIRLDNQNLNNADLNQNEKMKSILDKQMQIENLFEQLMDDELRELFKEFEKLAGEMTKKERLEKTSEIKSNIENLERQLDINLELLKKLEISKEILNISDQLKELANELNEQAPQMDTDSLMNRFNEIEERYEEQLEKNRELKKPEDLKSFEEQRKDINELLEKSIQEERKSEKSPDKKSEEIKKEAGSKMKELSQEMEMQVGGGGPSSQIDLEQIRQLMRELNDYSFEQERLLLGLDQYNSRSVRFIETGQQQVRMALKFGVIRDSLVSLGYQEPMIASLINQELFHVETSLKNMDRSVQEGNISQVQYEQQKVMEGSNELAVRLDELLRNIQAMQGEGEGKNQFTDSNPKDGGKKISEMKGMQESMKEQMKQMIQQMKSGSKSGNGSQEMVKMLSEREQLRKALEELRNSGSIGKDAKDKLNDAQQMMEEVEKDIIYNRLTEQTIKKEEWIQTRLLEAESAEKERDQEETRVSNEYKGSGEKNDLPGWKTIQPKVSGSDRNNQYPEVKLRPYYQEKFRSYLKNLNKEKNGR